MTHYRQPSSFMLAGLLLIYAPVAMALGTVAAPPSGPGLGAVEPRRNQESDSDPVHAVQKSISQAQRRSRAALERFRVVTVEHVARVNGAENAFVECRRRGQAACLVHAEELEAVRSDANFAIHDAAYAYRETLIPLIELLHRELAQNVVGDDWVFRRLQSDSFASGIDLLGSLVTSLDRLRQMVATADEIIRARTRLEIDRQGQILAGLERLQADLDRQTPGHHSTATFSTHNQRRSRP